MNLDGSRLMWIQRLLQSDSPVGISYENPDSIRIMRKKKKKTKAAIPDLQTIRRDLGLECFGHFDNQVKMFCFKNQVGYYWNFCVSVLQITICEEESEVDDITVT